jgi:hypothetical protein
VENHLDPALGESIEQEAGPSLQDEESPSRLQRGFRQESFGRILGAHRGSRYRHHADR